MSKASYSLESQRFRKGCFAKCGKKSGPCEDCGPNGLCCKRGLIENGCDGNMGKRGHHTCVTPEEPPTTDAPIIELAGIFRACLCPAFVVLYLIKSSKYKHINLYFETVPSYPLECNKNASTLALCKKPENCPQVANKKKGFNTYIFQMVNLVSFMPSCMH